MEATDLVMDLATEAMGMAATCGREKLKLSPALATMVVSVCRLFGVALHGVFHSKTPAFFGLECGVN